ncbi:hypothetical protein M0R45_023515 [Rubus argutus]|uniref:Uncharacterized protein n=1 Tax=Rubus argutus TaxID=59490 RepID=A0AAW1WN86_RUBAR
MERVRNRREKDGEDDIEKGGGKRKKMAQQVIEADKEAAATEEEVEEFFAIVKRMQAAVKYFEKGSINNNGGGDQVRWRVALESMQPVLAAAADDPAMDGPDLNDYVKTATSDDQHEHLITEGDNNGVLRLNLNEAPDQET